jgi:hypothetical protein
MTANFLRFLPVFGEKIGVFLKNQSYDTKTQIFANFFGKHILNFTSSV